MIDFANYEDKLNNKPIFTEEDVLNCQNPLMKMLKEMMVKEKMTLKQFIEKHDAYMRSINVDQWSSNYKKNNILKVILRKDEITWKTFAYVVGKVFKKNILSFSMTDIDTKGEKTIHEIKCSL